MPAGPNWTSAACRDSILGKANELSGEFPVVCRAFDQIATTSFATTFAILNGRGRSLVSAEP